MRTNFEYKSKEEIASEKARFETLRYYFKDDDWFDKEAILRWEENKMDVQYNIRYAGKEVDHISMIRVPTKCSKCKRAWAIEILKGSKNKFGPVWLDQSVYKTIPCKTEDACDKFPGDPICEEHKNG